MPKIYGELINYFNGESTIVQLVDGKLNYGVIAGFAAVYIFSAAIAVICMYYNGLILYVTGQYVVHDIRKDLFEHVESLSMAQINAMPAGKFVTRITNDCRGLSNFFTELIVMFFRDILNIIMILIISILLSWQLSLIFICFLPIIFFLSYILGNILRNILDNNGDLDRILMDSYQRISPELELSKSSIKRRLW